MIGLPIFLYTAPLACFDFRKISELRIVSGETEMPTCAHLWNVSKHPRNFYLTNLLIVFPRIIVGGDYYFFAPKLGDCSLREAIILYTA